MIFRNKKKKPKKTKGLKCPECGCQDWRLLDGRPFDCIKTVPLSGSIRRYKQCRYCGKIVRTKEVLDMPDKKT